MVSVLASREHNIIIYRTMYSLKQQCQGDAHFNKRLPDTRSYFSVLGTSVSATRGDDGLKTRHRLTVTDERRGWMREIKGCRRPPVLSVFADLAPMATATVGGLT